MGTLQFTERLGYHKDNAILMLAAGCYDALWALRTHLEAEIEPDARDRQVLAMARKWMGFDVLPQEKASRKKCTRDGGAPARHAPYMMATAYTGIRWKAMGNRQLGNQGSGN